MKAIEAAFRADALYGHNSDELLGGDAVRARIEVLLAEDAALGLSNVDNLRLCMMRAESAEEAFAREQAGRGLLAASPAPAAGGVAGSTDECLSCQ